jgi:site-specific DNA-methyltransferase (adenine-specific)
MEASITWNWKERTGSNKMWVIWWTIAKYAKDWDWTKRYPRSVQKFTRDNWLHPTQKPVALIEYLIKTYTNENETVLDFTMWSGTTWVACKNTNRNFIGIEMDKWYFEIAEKRILI